MRRSIATLTFLAAGCGSDDYGYEPHADVNSADYADGNAKLAIIADESSGAVRFYIAAAPDSATVSLCELSGADCRRTIAATFLRAGTDRRFYKADQAAALATDSTWRITVRTSAGNETIQKVRIAAPQTGGGSVSEKMDWKVVLMASDQGNKGAWITAFDNARNKLNQLFRGFGVDNTSISELSLRPEHQRDNVQPTNLKNFVKAVEDLQVAGTDDACLVHMTSHGSRDGFNLGSARLPPRDLDAALTRGCGDRPTVVLISACFSGLYVQDSSGVKKPNRIILTAARHDRTSFGCSPENQYTYWDNCLIDNLPLASTFKELAGKIEACIIRKEGGSTSSFPQSFIVADVANLAIPGK
jgi:hypothetical protein